MNLLSLLQRLPNHKAATLTYENGKVVRHPHAELFDHVRRACSILSGWGVKQGMRVGIYAPNSYAWIVYDLALIELRAVSVPFTEDFTGTVNKDLIDRYDISLLLISKSHADLFPEKTEFVAFLDADNTGIKAIPRPHLPADPDFEEMSLVFSSGSAGGLKGLVISRKGIEANLLPIVKAVNLNSKDRWLLFLPMSNFQQRSMYYAALWYDFDIIVTDYSRLFQALKDLHPTMLVAPPMFYELIETRYSNSIAGKKQRTDRLSKLISLLPTQFLRRVIARKLFPEFHSIFGGRMRMLITGMAPVRPSVADLFARMQLPLAESYGLVEAGSLTFRPPQSRKYASVGKLLDGTKIRVAEDGEIIVRRPNMLTLRYFQCADGENERTFLDSGEVATGDVGRLDSDGDLILLGRKKEVIVTSGGYKIHPEVLEGELDHCPEIAKAVIFARQGAPGLVALIRPKNPRSETARAAVENFIQEMNAANKQTKIVETIFTEIEFSRENQMLRPNLKLDRRNIAKRFNI